MTRISMLAALFIASALAACGDEPKKAVRDPETKVTVEAPKPAAPAKAAVPEKPWTSKDAKGHDWAAQMGAIQFDTDWKAAMARARASGKPILLLFTEKTSADAAKMAVTFKDPRVIAAAGEFVTTLVDNDANGPLAERFNVKGAPTVVYASSAGEELGATMGVDADEILRDIKSALTTMKEDSDEGK